MSDAINFESWYLVLQMSYKIHFLGQHPVDNCQDTRILGWVLPIMASRPCLKEALLERGTVFSLPVYERVGISQVEVYGRVVKSVI